MCTYIPHIPLRRRPPKRPNQALPLLRDERRDEDDLHHAACFPLFLPFGFAETPRALFTGSPVQLCTTSTTSRPASASGSISARVASMSGWRSLTVVACWMEGKAMVWQFYIFVCIVRILSNPGGINPSRIYLILQQATRLCQSTIFPNSSCVPLADLAE